MWFQKSVNLAKVVYIGTFIVSAISIIGLQSDRYQQVAEEIANPNYLEQEKELQTALNFKKAIPNFGFDNLFADSFYLGFVQYFGDETARKATGYTLTTEYFKEIAKRDPQFIKAYLTLSAANSMYAGQAETTVSLMEEILTANPHKSRDSYLLWTLKGMDETIFLGNTQAAKNSYLQAAKIASKHPHSNSEIVAFNQKRARHLATNPDTTEAQIIAWKSVLSNVVKEEEKQIIRDRLAALEAKQE